MRRGALKTPKFLFKGRMREGKRVQVIKTFKKGVSSRFSLVTLSFFALSLSVKAQTEVEGAALPLSDAENRLGWTLTPQEAEEADDRTELDRLSRSPSGVTFGAIIYNSQSDNPLVPISVTLRALDKITANYTDLEIPIGEEASFGPLTLLPRTCDKRPPEETPETTVFLEVFSGKNDVLGERVRANLGTEIADVQSRIRLPGEGPRDLSAAPALFRGWMFASSPSLNALEHPVYDVWVIDCKMVDPEV